MKSYYTLQSNKQWQSVRKTVSAHLQACTFKPYNQK